MKLKILAIVFLVSILLLISGCIKVEEGYWERTRSLSECASEKNSISKDICYWSVAVHKKDSSICEKIHYSQYQKSYLNFCYRDIAIATEDPSLCKKMQHPCPDTLDECYFNTCKKIENQGRKDECYYYIAIEMQDSSLCENIESQYKKGECYSHAK